LARGGNNGSNGKQMKATAITLCLAFVGLALFCKGLFLTRYELRNRSEGGGWMPPRHSRLVLFIIDALREDMVTLQRSNDGQETACATAVCRYAHNRMQFAQRLVMQDSSQTALFVFEADPPTVTSQRLKGLTTGGLPTFIDISSNFGSDVLREDNLIDQFVAHRKR
jgi:phosphatidylinositol glycan class O